MMSQRVILEFLAGRRVTAVEIGEILDVTEKTARKRLAAGLNASDVITICRAVGINPVEALVQMEFLTTEETMKFVDSDGELLATADQETLILELIDRSLSTSQLADLLAARTRRSNEVYRPSGVDRQPGNVRELTSPNQPSEFDDEINGSDLHLRSVADNSPREDGHGGDVGAWDA
ncbi:hypothetical protein R3Q06_28725 [Rhodococcus erythropolis]|uniref:hypothetical protein n=1 Tax=Rhodococcus erythropolis TaxID=1833 RepID=UPI00294903AA|nr:hypothetical protein [Rhodococcus erythropolis]MDV6277486.1 hypothetical protein [Rhodococcus erythropolis]